MNYHNKNRKDPCTHTCTRGVNVPARVLTRRNVPAHVYASCARVCTRIFTKIFVVVLYYLINLSLKFHKDRCFRCGDICKTILIFKNQDCCANISATKARIFIKFQTYIHKIVKNYQKIFCKDPCTHS